MHPKEFKKTKNGTGRFTHLSLPNSEIHIGESFQKHAKINALLSDSDKVCYVLYPSQTSIDLNTQNIALKGKQIVIFLIDATWPCSRHILKHSPNLDALPKISFTHTKTSGFQFKQQPKDYCLSTMESTLCVLELLKKHKIEEISGKALEQFLHPFHKMVAYQLSCK